MLARRGDPQPVRRVRAARRVPLGGLPARYGDIARLDRILEAEGDSPNRYQLSKQADVLMLFYVLSADELGQIIERLGYRYDPS